MKSKEIKIFGFEECPYCKELKKMFDDSDLRYVYVDIENDENKEETEKIFKAAENELVPIVLIGNTLLVPEKSFKTIEECFGLCKRFLGL
jgi:glutaredoxin